MPQVGIREFKGRASQILQRVRQGRESFQITYRGKVVAVLTPVADLTERAGEQAQVWAEMDELANELALRWPAGVTAAEAVAEQRREL